MACCEVEKYNWCKEEPTIDVDGAEYCIFHAPKGKKGISLSEFNYKVLDKIDLARRTQGFCSLSGTVFDGDIGFKQQTYTNTPMPHMDLSYTVFHGDADFSNLQFQGNFFLNHGCCFGNVDFSRACFGKITFFDSCEFKGSAVFEGTEFTYSISFYDTRFNRDVNFKSNFKEALNFINTVFIGNTEFSTSFHGKTYLSKVNFHKEVNFSLSHFHDEVTFSDVDFMDKASFSGAQFDKMAYFFGKTFSSDAAFIWIRAKDRIRFEQVNLRKVSFMDTDLMKFDFINCEWPKKFGREMLYDEMKLFYDTDNSHPEKISENIQLKWKGFKKDISCDKEQIKKVESLYRRLKQKFKDEHNELEAYKWHYAEKEMFRKSNLWRRFLPSLTTLYWLSSGHGERPARAAFVLIVQIAIASLLLSVFGVESTDSEGIHGINSILLPNSMDIEKGWALFLNTLKYATFQKDPFFKPINWPGETVKLLAQVFIPVQATLFVLAVKNRFKR